MSEFDSLSDSDWLDLSTRTDDDNDSISSREGINSQPLSRRSSISFGSSHDDSEVEAWEGFVDEPNDESAIESGMCIVQPLAAHAAESFPIGSLPDISHDSSDDQRTKDGLEQSLIGTLASRPASAVNSTHNSIRDLRLSFPDPLTSSRDQLDRSLKELARLDSTASLEDHDNHPPVALDQQIIPSAEPEAPFISQVPHHAAYQPDNDTTNTGLDIMLYGTSSPIKWSFVQSLIKKAAGFSGNVVLNILDPNFTGPVQSLELRCGKDNSILTSVTVHDLTNDLPGTVEADDVIRASLAIVYLPSTTLPALSLHTAYLPVIVPQSEDEKVDDCAQQVAEDDWELLAVPISRTINFNELNKSPVLDAEDLAQVESWKVFEVIRNLLDRSTQVVKYRSDNTHQIHAVTFFALMSIIMGFAFNTAFHTSVPLPAGTVKNSSGNSWITSGQVNRSFTGSLSSTGTALITSSMKDFALTILNPGTTSLTVPSQSNSLAVTSRVTSLSIKPQDSSLSLIHTPCTSYAEAGPSRLPTTADKSQPRASSSKEVLIRPVITTSLTTIPSVPSSLSTTPTWDNIRKPQPRTQVTSSEFTGLIVDGLSEIFDETKKVLNNVVKDNGIQDLVEAVDELMDAIHVQTQTLVRQSKGKARALGEEVLCRNDRAKDRAKDLKKKSTEYFNAAASQFYERTMVARKRAKGIKETLKQKRSESWKLYERKHSDLVAKVKAMEQTNSKDKPGWSPVESQVVMVY